MSRGPVTRVVTGLGELCVTAGAVLLLFCVYQLWWTNVEAAHARSATLSDLSQAWRSDDTPDYGAPATAVAASPAAQPVARPAKGTAFALIRIPRLGSDWRQPIIEGVTATELHEGIGHYIGTAMPGQRGNLALAGHRATNGEPFRDLDAMQTGDEVIVETRDVTYTYVVDKPWTLVSPDAIEVIAPVPGRPGVRATTAKLTLTTCNPRWASTQRLIVETTLRSAVRRG